MPMAWNDKSSAAFTGGSGQMAVMAELLHRKCNAAIPQIDVGLDVFAFRDDREEIARIQVKTANAKFYKSGPGYHAKFGIPMTQLKTSNSPPLYYALAVRLERGWGHFIIISRNRLREIWLSGCGSENEKSGDLELHIQFRPEENRDSAFCGVVDLSEHLNDWETLPPLKPKPPVNTELESDQEPFPN